jgi:hypothetical protein
MAEITPHVSGALGERSCMQNGNHLDYDCNWRFAFNLRSGAKSCVGYLMTCTGLGGVRLKKDIQVWNPFDGQGQQDSYKKAKIDCIGLIESFRFMGGENDPIRIVTYVSKGTAADLRARLATPLSNLKLKLDWYIIDFDNETKAWYEAAFVKSAAGADANLSSGAGTLQIFIENTPEKITDSLDVGVYRFELEVLPADESSTNLEFASGPNQKLVRRWTSR